MSVVEQQTMSHLNTETLMKKAFTIASFVVGIIGLGVFFRPILEISCGIGGLICGLIGKDKNAGKGMKTLHSFGISFAWLNILWVCLEFGLKYAGIDLFSVFD